ncbi:MAG: DNA recombination protein RmuC [Candidatus Izemoplasmatales bacterium]
MGFVEIALVVLLVLAVFSCAAVVYLLVRPKAADPHREELNALARDTRQGIADLKSAVSQSIFTAIIDFNDKVNLKLSDNAEKSGANIADFRMSVNRELTEFRDSVGARLNAEFKTMAEAVEKQMGAINVKVEERLKQGFVDTNQTFAQISARIQVIDAAQKNIEDLSKQMISLEGILTNNQSRGMFGEYQLEKVLFSVFGVQHNLYELQYTIREEKGKAERVRADAVVHLPGPAGLIAIDSKFPFANYARLFGKDPLAVEEREKIVQAFGADVKKHITAIAAKYIIPGKTLDHALMFVPTDGILTLIHSELQNVIDYANQKNVTIVSPTILVPLLSSYFAVMIDYQRTLYASQIKKELDSLTKEFGKFAEEWEKLSINIEKIGRQSSDVNLRVGKITTKFGQIDRIRFPEETPAIEAEVEDRSEGTE